MITERMMTANIQAYSQVYRFYTRQAARAVELVAVESYPRAETTPSIWRYAMAAHFISTTAGLCPARSNVRSPICGDCVVTAYSSVPLGYAMLLPHLESDEKLRHNFFRDLKYLGCAGAGIPRHHWEQLQRMAIEITGSPVIFGTNWGATETGPTVTAVYFQSDRPNNIGLPIPGTELRLVPTDGKLELRVRGPSITPGYWNDPDQTAKAFDADGFYRTGDAGKFIDPNDPAEGLQFDGRVARELQAFVGHMGQRRRAADERDPGCGAAGAGCGGDWP